MVDLTYRECCLISDILQDRLEDARAKYERVKPGDKSYRSVREKFCTISSLVEKVDRQIEECWAIKGGDH